jgi:putative endonuclease
MTNSEQTFGRWGKATAAACLEKNGNAILERNFHTAHAEIDIVASKAAQLIFVEGKTRSSHAFAYPEDSVTKAKQAHLLSAAAYFLQMHPESCESWRFDVIAIERKSGTRPEIEHFENVIA